jgi:hypothetical protein
MPACLREGDSLFSCCLRSRSSPTNSFSLSPSQIFMKRELQDHHIYLHTLNRFKKIKTSCNFKCWFEEEQMGFFYCGFIFHCQCAGWQIKVITHAVNSATRQMIAARIAVKANIYSKKRRSLECAARARYIFYNCHTMIDWLSLCLPMPFTFAFHLTPARTISY